MVYKNGSKYEGMFNHGKRQGKGTYYYVNGSIYTGDWRDNAKHGHGTITFRSGRKYISEFSSGHTAIGEKLESDQTSAGEVPANNMFRMVPTMSSIQDFHGLNDKELMENIYHNLMILYARPENKGFFNLIKTSIDHFSNTKKNIEKITTFLNTKVFFNMPNIVNCDKIYYRILLVNEDITNGLSATDPLAENSLAALTLMHHTVKSQYQYLTSSTSWLLWNLCNIFHQHPKSRVIKVAEINLTKALGSIEVQPVEENALLTLEGYIPPSAITGTIYFKPVSPLLSKLLGIQDKTKQEAKISTFPNYTEWLDSFNFTFTSEDVDEIMAQASSYALFVESQDLKL